MSATMHERPHPVSDCRKRSVRRTALWLALLAASFYLGFIAMAVLRAQ